MTKSRMNKKRTTRKRNPLHFPPRATPRPNVTNFDGQTLNLRTTFSEMTGVANVIASHSYMDVRSGGVSLIGSAGSAIANTYSEYKYNKCSVHWLPSVAPGVAAGGGRVWMAYLDNPEQMLAWTTASNDADRVTAIKTIRNRKSWNAWEQFTYNIPITYRRKKFDVNVTITNSVDILDRSTQGLLVIAAETVGATDTIGRMEVESHITLYGFNILAT